ncbi:MAG TPA: response regulator [bacterium]|nr:response regulator [bacterium]HPP86635.1 response regulator [bacterium]
MTKEELKILLVEDNDDHAELLLMELEDKLKDIELFRVSDGEEALDYLYRRGDKYSKLTNHFLPDLILLDLRLPKIDGIEVLSTIKNDKNLKKIPVVMLTSSDAENDIIEAYNNYANSYLVKPLNFDKFSKMLDSLAEYWIEWNRQPN